MFFLPDNDGVDIKCSMCSKYLSVSPVIISSDRPICGRCVQQFEYSTESRADFYETLAKHMVFPCVNDVHGCFVKLPWGEVLDHEAKCTFRKIPCPATDCDCVIANDEIIDHIKTNHEDLILTVSNSDRSVSLKSGQSNNILLWNDHWLILQTSRDWEITLSFSDNSVVIGTHKNICCRISSLDSNIPEVVKVNLILESYQTKNILSVKDIKVLKYESKLPTLTAWDRISDKFTETTSFSYKHCRIKFDEFVVSQNNTNEKMLSNLECPICMHHMLPPIYMCSKGHNFCRECKEKLPQCPYCSTNIDIINSSLELFAELVTYPCRYKDNGCTFIGTAKDVTRHQPMCCKSLQNDIICFTNYITPCEWKGRYTDVFDHISSSHTNYCIDIKHPVSVDVNAHSKYGFWQYGQRIFEIYLGHDSETKMFQWSVTSITNYEFYLDDYMCYLHFTKGKRIFTISELCDRAENMVRKRCYNTMPLVLLKPFMEDEKLTFEIHVIKL